jgi:predicted Zn finger-like uncharacterized protein
MRAAHEGFMNVTCPQCSTVFRVDPAKVPEQGVRARCSVCSGLIAVRRPAMSAPATVPERRAEPPQLAEPQAQPRQTPPSPVAMPARAPAIPSESPPVRSDAERSQPISRPLEPPAAPSPVRVYPPAELSLSPPAPPVVRPTERAPAFEPFEAPALPPRSSPTPVPAPAPAPAVPPVEPFARSGGPQPGRFNNPFLQQDPATRARRLARALVSDLVVYYPEKRERGLAEGNLKELFAEEIRKSWEEYTGQVGQDIASTTPYFTEALNEILAEGRAVFG